MKIRVVLIALISLLTFSSCGEVEMPEIPDGETVENSGKFIKGFSFSVKDNEGKIFDEAFYDGSRTVLKKVNALYATITETRDCGFIDLCIPYLYDFNLVPSFYLAPGMKATVEGELQASGENEHDFSREVVYKISKGKSSRDYKVRIRNTGLPIVTLTQTEVTLNTGAESNRTFLHHFLCPAKNEDFGKEDIFALYDTRHPENNVEPMKCGFRLRGNSSMGYPKKSFALKLSSKTALPGMAKHKRWCLLSGWGDRTTMRHRVAFRIANTLSESFKGGEEDAVLGPGLGWNPSGCAVELVYNGVHVGSYILCEQIKIDKNRVDIQDSCEDQDNPTIESSGYLLEFDDYFDEPIKYVTKQRNLPAMSKYDIPDPAIWKYVTDYVQEIEDRIHNEDFAGAYEMMDLNSSIDMWLVLQLTGNNEFHHPKSIYMYKDGLGKLYSGPVWDFDYRCYLDHELLNADPDLNRGSSFNSGRLTSILGTTETLFPYTGDAVNGDAPYMWYPRLLKDPIFIARLKARWNASLPDLKALRNDIIKMGEELSESDRYNHAMWPAYSLEKKDRDYNGDEKIEDWDKAVEHLADWYKKRVENLDKLIEKL